MKTILYRVVCYLFLSLGLGAGVFAQGKAPKKLTLQIPVKGLCGMCEEKIEGALNVKGVKQADWDQAKQMVTVTYEPKKITEDKIHKLISEAGYETDKVAASAEVYAKLPLCCQYKRKN